MEEEDDEVREISYDPVSRGVGGEAGLQPLAQG